MNSLWKESSFKAYEDKIQRGIFLSGDEILSLLRSYQLPSLGNLANFVRGRYWEKRRQHTTYVTGSELPLEKVSAGSQSTRLQTLQGFHFLRGFNSKKDWNDFFQAAKLFRSQEGETSIAAFTAQDLDLFSQTEGCSVVNALNWLKQAKLTHLVEGDVEWCEDPKRARTITWKRYLEIHRAAHEQNIKTKVVLILDPKTTDAIWTERLLDLQKLQNETHGFEAVTLQANYNPRIFGRLQIPMDGFSALRLVAVIRLALSNIPGVKLAWTAQDSKLAQVALHFGANDIGSTWAEDIAPQDRLKNGLTVLKPQDLIQMIEQSGGQAQERKVAYAF